MQQSQATTFDDLAAHSSTTELGEAIKAATVPSRRVENWKYTSLAGVPQSIHERIVDASCAIEAASDDVRVSTVDHSHAFINSCVSKTTSPEGLSEKQAQPFNTINHGLVGDIHFIEIADKALVKEPIHIDISNASEGFNNARFAIDIGKHAEALIVIRFTNHSNESLLNSIVEIAVGENAKLHLIYEQVDEEASYSINGLHIKQAANSVVNSYPLMLAGKLRRSDFRSQMQGSNAELNVRGFFLSTDKNHNDAQFCVEHQVPYCTSFHDIKGLSGGHATSVFNGRIHIHKGALQTQADLSNKNLLLAKTATINTKPELEIYNDDVKCSHGTTIGQLDPQAIYYLQTRGIDEHQAKLMLARAFIGEVLENLPHIYTQEDALENRYADELAAALMQKITFSEA